ESAIVWRADRKGHQRWFGKIELTFDDNCLRVGKKVIRLTWIISVDDLGPGFRVTWRDSKGSVKRSAFCCPTVKGYSRGRRNQIVNALRGKVETALGKSVS